MRLSDADGINGPFIHSRHFVIIVGKAQVLLITCFKFPGSHDRVTVKQHVQDPDTEAAEWNSAIFNSNYLHLCFPDCDMSKCLLFCVEKQMKMHTLL